MTTAKRKTTIVQSQALPLQRWNPTLYLGTNLMGKLFIDIETRSPKPLPKVGVWAYAEEAKITLCAYALNDEDVKLWDCTANPVMPSDLLKHLKDDAVMCVAHNSLFERILFKKSLNITLPPHRWICTSVLARANGLPASLKNACTALKFPETLTKMEEGKALIARFCKGSIDSSPYDPTRANHVQAWRLFGEYCKRDVEATRELFKQLPPLSSDERSLWLLDQEINDRGYLIDVSLTQKLQELIAIERERLDEEFKELTDGVIGSARRTELLNKYLFLYTGLDLPDMAESTIATALSQPDIPQLSKDILNNRLSSSQSAILKLNTLSGAVSPDNRLRGTLQFFGASRTGRWSGRVFQPQNLPRQTLAVDELERLIRGRNSPAHNQHPLTSDSDRARTSITKAKKNKLADAEGTETQARARAAGEQEKRKPNAKAKEKDKKKKAKAKNINIPNATKNKK
nr:hypothetical protein [Candidatus Liberibacter solanacearum]